MFCFQFLQFIVLGHYLTWVQFKLRRKLYTIGKGYSSFVCEFFSHEKWKGKKKPLGDAIFLDARFFLLFVLFLLGLGLAHCLITMGCSMFWFIARLNWIKCYA